MKYLVAILFFIGLFGNAQMTDRFTRFPDADLGIVLIDSTDAWFDTDVDFTVAVPSGVADGLVGVIAAGGDFNQETGPIFSQTEAPTDFTFETTWGDTSSDNHVGVFWKELDGTETGNFVVDNPQASSGTEGWVKCWVFDGVDTTDPFGAIGTEENVNGTNTITVPGITTTVAGSWVLVIWGTDGSNMNYVSHSGTDFVFGDEISGSDSENYSNGGYLIKYMPTIGATGNVTINIGGANNDGINAKMLELLPEL